MATISIEKKSIMATCMPLSPLEHCLRHLETTSTTGDAFRMSLTLKNDNYGGKTREASEGMENDFYFTEYDFCPV